MVNTIITILDKVDTYQRICCRKVLESNANLTLKTVYTEGILEVGSR